MTIRNSKIYNSSNFGILGRSTSITAENVVLNNAGQSAFAGTYGGTYNFIHSTIANYWSHSFRQFPALYLNNFLILEDDTVMTNPLTAANFTNCIIYGNDNPEFLVEHEDGTALNFKFTNCLIRFQDTNNKFGSDPNYNFDNSALYENIVLNKDPDFQDISKNKLYIGQESAAINVIGNNPFSNSVPLDLLNVNRTAMPDLGAYQHISFE